MFDSVLDDACRTSAALSDDLYGLCACNLKSEKAQKNILVLGGTGYLGVKLIKGLVDSGYIVFATKRRTSDIRALNGIGRLHWVTANIDFIRDVMESCDIDCIINLVCNYGRSTELYGDVIEANIEFPLDVLNIASEYHVKRFITIDSALPENLNMYSFTKSMFARFGRFYSEKEDISFMNLRLQMFYGSDEPDERFIPQSIRKLLAGEDVYATEGSQKRDIVAIEDVVRAIITVMNHTASFENWEHRLSERFYSF